MMITILNLIVAGLGDLGFAAVASLIYKMFVG